jgi:hypothetical protein
MNMRGKYAGLRLAKHARGQQNAFIIGDKSPKANAEDAKAGEVQQRQSKEAGGIPSKGREAQKIEPPFFPESRFLPNPAAHNPH